MAVVCFFEDGADATGHQTLALERLYGTLRQDHSGVCRRTGRTAAGDGQYCQEGQGQAMQGLPIGVHKW